MLSFWSKWTHSFIIWGEQVLSEQERQEDKLNSLNFKQIMIYVLCHKPTEWNIKAWWQHPLIVVREGYFFLVQSSTLSKPVVFAVLTSNIRPHLVCAPEMGNRNILNINMIFTFWIHFVFCSVYYAFWWQIYIYRLWLYAAQKHIKFKNIGLKFHSCHEQKKYVFSSLHLRLDLSPCMVPLGVDVKITLTNPFSVGDVHSLWCQPYITDNTDMEIYAIYFILQCDNRCHINWRHLRVSTSQTHITGERKGILFLLLEYILFKWYP